MAVLQTQRTAVQRFMIQTNLLVLTLLAHPDAPMEAQAHPRVPSITLHPAQFCTSPPRFSCSGLCPALCLLWWRWSWQLQRLINQSSGSDRSSFSNASAVADLNALSHYTGGLSRTAAQPCHNFQRMSHQSLFSDSRHRLHLLCRFSAMSMDSS